VLEIISSLIVSLNRPPVTRDILTKDEEISDTTGSPIKEATMVSTDQVILQEPTLRRENSGQTMTSKETEAMTRSGTQATTQLSKRSEQERATMVMTSQSAWKRTGTKTRLGETSLTTHLRELTIHLTIMVLKGIGKIRPKTQSLDELTTLTIDKTETGQTTPTKINGRDKETMDKMESNGTEETSILQETTNSLTKETIDKTETGQTTGVNWTDKDEMEMMKDSGIVEETTILQEILETSTNNMIDKTREMPTLRTVNGVDKQVMDKTDRMDKTDSMDKTDRMDRTTSNGVMVKTMLPETRSSGFIDDSIEGHSTRILPRNTFHDEETTLLASTGTKWTVTYTSKTRYKKHRL